MSKRDYIKRDGTSNTKEYAKTGLKVGEIEKGCLP